MIVQIQDCLVSESVLQEAFSCDLDRCQGACCVEGEAGAPLEQEEVNFLAGSRLSPTFLKPVGKQLRNKALMFWDLMEILKPLL